MRRSRLLLPLTAAALGAALPLSSCGGGSGGGSGGGATGAALFAKSYGGTDLDGFADAEEAPDGGYVAVGSIAGAADVASGRMDDLLVARLDALGDVGWTRSIALGAPAAGPGASVQVYVRTVVGAGDGAAFAAGTVVEEIAPGELHYSVHLERVGSAGVQWTSRFDVELLGGSEAPYGSLAAVDAVERVVPAPDGGAFVAGATTGVGVTDGEGNSLRRSAWVARVDPSGTPLWARPLHENLDGPNLVDGTLRLVATGDGSVYLAATAYDGGLGSSRRLDVLRVGPLGNVSWRASRGDLVLRHASASIHPGFGAADGFVVAGDGGGADESRLVAFDAEGTRVLDATVPLTRADACAGFLFTPAGEVAYQVAGVSSAAPDALSVARVDTNGAALGTTTSVLDRRCHDMRARIDGAFLFESIVAGAPAFATDPIGPGALVTSRTTEPPFQARVVAPVSLDVRRPAGFDPPTVGWRAADGSVWAWFSGGGRDSTFNAFSAAGALAWSATFNESALERLERAVDVEIVSSATAPDDWRIVALGRVEHDVDGDGSPEQDVPWLVALLPDGAVVSEAALSVGSLPARATSGALDASTDGELFVGLVAGGLPRVAKVALDGTVRWVSAPASGVPDGPIDTIEVAALGDGGAVAATSQTITRYDADGVVVWRRRLPRPFVMGLAASGERIGVLTRGVGLTPAFSSTVGLDIVDLGGERLAETLWNVDVDVFESRGGALVALKDGGWAAVADASYFSGNAALSTGASMITVLGIGPDGAPAWRSEYGGRLDERATGLSTAGDGGLLVTGTTRSVTLNQDAWLLRLDSCGRIGTACAAEFVRQEAGFDFESQILFGGPALPELALEAQLDASVALTPSATAAASVDPGPLLVTRQCSGTSKDGPAAPNGSFVTLNVRIGGIGTVSDDAGAVPPVGVSCTSDCQFVVPAGTLVELTGTPATGFGTPTWSGGDCGGGPSETCSILMDRARTLVVTFPSDGTYSGLGDLIVQHAGTGSGRVLVEPPGLFCDDSCVVVDIAAPGETISVTAFPDTGSTFGGFTGQTDADGNQAFVTFGAGDRTLTVRFD